QAIAYAIAARVERLAIYKLKDEGIVNGEPYGLVRNDLTLRPAFTAYQTAIREFAGLDSAQISSTAAVVQIALSHGTRRVTVAWSPSPNSTNVDVAPVGIAAEVADKGGHFRAIGLPTDPANPRYAFSLPGATNNTVD